MREISPAHNMNTSEFLRLVPPDIQTFVEAIRSQKRAGMRPLPSATLIDKSDLLSKERRIKLLDNVAVLVDENLFGRTEMCVQFALLIDLAMKHLGISSCCVSGTAIYYNRNGQEIFRWQHAWVRIGKEVIDGNVDILAENPIVPDAVDITPYWGPINETPNDRKLCDNHGEALPDDQDVNQVWWPDLLTFLQDNF